MYGKIGFSGGEGGYILWANFGKSRGEGGGAYEKSLPWVGYGYFLEPHNVVNYSVYTVTALSIPQRSLNLHIFSGDDWLERTV